MIMTIINEYQLILKNFLWWWWWNKKNMSVLNTQE